MVRNRAALLAGLIITLSACNLQTSPPMSDMTPEEQRAARAIEQLTGQTYRDNGYLNEAARNYYEAIRGDVSAWLRGRFAALAAPVEAHALRAWTVEADSPEAAAQTCVSGPCAQALTLPTLTVRITGGLYVIAGADLRNKK